MLSLPLILDVSTSFLYGGLIFLTLREFLPPRLPSRAVSLIEAALLGLIGNIIVFPEEVTGTFGSLLGFLALIICFHKSRWPRKLSATLILFPAMTSISFLLQDFGQMIWLYGFDKSLSPAGETALYLLMRLLRLPVWLLIYRCVKRWLPQAAQSMTLRMWLVVNLVSLASFAGVISMICQVSASVSYLAWPACVAALVASLGCCYLCTYMSRVARSEAESQAWQYRRAYCQEIEERQQALHRMGHDMRNHLNIVRTFLRDGDCAGAQDYLQKLDQEFTAPARTYCSNAVVNAVLNVKLQKCLELGIPCEYQTDLNEDLPLDDIDLCSLFANTLDNAIEASLKIPEKDRRLISLKARCFHGHFTYEIVNAKSNDVLERNGNFETDKGDSHAHGIGLKAVRQIVEKYQGEIEIQYTDGEFRVVVMI